MTRRLKILLILLTTVSLSPLSAFNYGARFNIGMSRGTGSEWYSALKQAGSISFNKSLPTMGIGVFAEFDLKSNYLFTPELYYVLNRGTAMRDDEDNFIRTQTINSLELLLPFAYDIEFDSGSKALRLLGGFQFRYSFNLNQRIKIDDNERFTEGMEMITPLSMGFVLGSGIEFKKPEKMSWLLDLRLIIPASASIRYSLPDGSENSFKSMELLIGTGIKF
jgi:Outer membrane protein beta-barrel domain